MFWTKRKIERDNKFQHWDEVLEKVNRLQVAALKVSAWEKELKHRANQDEEVKPLRALRDEALTEMQKANLKHEIVRSSYFHHLKAFKEKYRAENRCEAAEDVKKITAEIDELIGEQNILFGISRNPKGLDVYNGMQKAAEMADEEELYLLINKIF